MRIIVTEKGDALRKKLANDTKCSIHKSFGSTMILASGGLNGSRTVGNPKTGKLGSETKGALMMSYGGKLPSVLTKFTKSPFENNVRVRHIFEDPKVLIGQTKLGMIDTLEEEKMNKEKSLRLPILDRSKSQHTFILKKASIQEIMSTVESPSHWRFFENKRKVLCGDHSLNFDVIGSAQKKIPATRSFKLSKYIDEDYADRILSRQIEEEKKGAKLLKHLSLKKELIKEQAHQAVEPPDTRGLKEMETYLHRSNSSMKRRRDGLREIHNGN